MSNGPNGKSMSIGGPGGINYTNYGARGDSDDDDWEILGAMAGGKDPWVWPFGVSVNSNNNNNFNFGSNQINGWVRGNNSGANFTNRNSPFGFNGFPGPFNNNKFNWG
jgi:hypothetical protein